MNSYRRQATLLGAALSLALSGCAQSPRLDASSYEALNASFNKTRSSLSVRDHERFDEARKQFNAIYFSNGRDTKPKANLAPWQVVSGMEAQEFMVFVRALRRDDPLPPDPEFPSPALATRLLSQYRMEHSLLEQARSRAHDKGQNTIDQFPLLDVAYIPPMTDVPIELDKAEFVITIRNDSGFDAYNPEFRIRITKPGDDIPVLDRVFQHSDRRKPLSAGENLTMRFECCSLGTDPLHNKLLKGLTPDSDIEIELLQVSNFNNSALLDRQTFSPRAAQRIKVLELCIERISADPAGWVPYAEADQPGGCGDPKQADNLMAMWESQGVRPPREFRHLQFDHSPEPITGPQPTPASAQ